MGRVAVCQTADRQRAFGAEGVRPRPGRRRKVGVASLEGPQRGVLGGCHWGPLGPPGPTNLGGEGQGGEAGPQTARKAEWGSRGGEWEGWGGKWVKQKVRLRSQGGPRGLEVLGPPGWSHQGPSQSPPPSHSPRRGRRGPPRRACTQSAGSKLPPCPRPQRDRLQDRGAGRARGHGVDTGPGRDVGVRRSPSHPGTSPGAYRQTGWGCQVASRSPAAWELCRVALCLPLLPAPLPALHQVPGVGGSDVRPT